MALVHHKKHCFLQKSRFKHTIVVCKRYMMTEGEIYFPKWDPSVVTKLMGFFRENILEYFSKILFSIESFLKNLFL